MYENIHFQKYTYNKDNIVHGSFVLNNLVLYLLLQGFVCSLTINFKNTLKRKRIIF